MIQLHKLCMKIAGTKVSQTLHFGGLLGLNQRHHSKFNTIFLIDLFKESFGINMQSYF